MKTATRERPILFSGEMVRAILAGRKTVTRRVVKGRDPRWEVDESQDGQLWPYYPCYVYAEPQPIDLVCPYGRPGDRLWVREAWRLTCDTDAVCCVAYRADGAALHYLCDNGGEGDPTELAGPAGKLWDDDAARWRPSIHMPRWASRITLQVVSVRVERLQDITDDECVAEGFDGSHWWAGAARCDAHADLVVNQFQETWDQLNAGRGYSWDSNPWVWRVEFSRLIGG